MTFVLLLIYRFGCRRLASPLSVPKKCRSLVCAEQLSCSSDEQRGFIGIHSMICRKLGRQQPGIGKRKARAITGTFTWVCCGRMENQNAPSVCFQSSRLTSAFANGFILRITALGKQSGICASLGCLTYAPV